MRRRHKGPSPAQQRQATHFWSRYGTPLTPSEGSGVLKWLRSKFIADRDIDGPARGLKFRSCCNRVHASNQACGLVRVNRIAKSGRVVRRYTLPKEN